MSAIQASTQAARLIAESSPDDEDYRSESLMSLLQTDLFSMLVSLQEAEDADPEARVKLLSTAARAIADVSRASIAQKKTRRHRQSQTGRAIDRRPNGKGNKFYELMTDRALASVWSRHIVDIHAAVADGLPRDVAELKAGINDPDAWAQEYELQWLDEASAWLSYDLIDRCEEDGASVNPEIPPHPPFAKGGANPTEYPPLQKGGASAVSGGISQGGGEAGRIFYLGVDIGARHDLFVIWVLEQVGDVLWTRELITRQRISFAEQDALLDDCFRRYRVARCCMDQTGMGEKPVEDAIRRHGSRVEGVLFTTASKQHLATLAKDAFEDRKVRIPKGQREIREDLHKLQKVTSPTGAPRFIADRDSDGHADRAWALFLALNAASSPPEVYAYHPIRSRSALRRGLL